MSSVIVYGSVNADTILEVESFPLPGETIRAAGVQSGPGGKGLNQAVAAARMGASAVMVGALGTDPAAAALKEALAGENGLDLTRLREIPGPTGQAFVTVDGTGENNIMIVPGANGSHTAASAAEHLEFLARGDVLVCQLEIPFAAVAAALEVAKQRGAYTVLNAAPAAPVTGMLAHVDLLVVNETEAAAILAGLGQQQPGDPRAAAGELRHRAGTGVVITLGGDGLVYDTGEDAGALDAFPVIPVDTTGAGDAFVGALATMLAEGQPLTAALRFASALGALACTEPGAQGYRATRGQVQELAQLPQG